MGIFFTPLVKNFGYSHAKVSALSTVAFLATALFSWPRDGFWSGSIPAS
jgi:hypothetical protein